MIPRSKSEGDLCIFNEDDDAPYHDDDGMPAWADADADIAVLQESEGRHAIWLCANGREDEPVDGGMPAWFYRALYLDEP